MTNPLPMIIVGAAALLLLGKNKKTSRPDKGHEGDVEKTQFEVSEGLPGIGGEGEGYGIVDKGTRKDRRGHFSWRIYQDSEGYHAQIMLDDSRFSPIQEEVGVADSLGASKIMLRNRFNELLLSKYPSEKAKNDPSVARAK